MEWHAFPVPKTLQQKNAYLDACVQWIVRDAVNTHVESYLGSVSSVVVDASAPSLLHDDNEFNVPVQRTCAHCPRAGSHVLLANPFSIQCQLVLCDACAF